MNGSDIRRTRRELGLKQPEFGRMLGYSRSTTASELEHDKYELSDLAMYLLAQLSPNVRLSCERIDSKKP